MGDSRVVDLAALEGERRVQWVPDAFGRHGGCFVRGYDRGELSRWLRAAKRGDLSQVETSDRLETIQLAECLLKTEDPADKLFCVGDPTEEDLVRVLRLVPPGKWRVLVSLIDELSGFDGEVLERLEAAGVPFTGASSGSGVSTVVAGSPSSSAGRSKSGSEPTPTTAS